MKKPDAPHNETQRLKTLQSIGVLDTTQEERFDRLTRLAKRMFDVPIALVSLVDENRQWFKSCVGLNVSETPRDISFCGHSILGDDVFIVNDALLDKRFSDNPLVTYEPFIRFYAGCPITYMDGSKLGTLCIIDHEPRLFDQDDIGSLKDLAELVERELAAVQLATMDDLTNVSNRRGFIMLAENRLSLNRRQGNSGTLVFFDLNDFKYINDHYGHAQGDRALIDFANNMRDVFRESDIFARLGGDEFAVLLTNVTVESTNDITLRFKKSFQELQKKTNAEYTISFSSGVVEIDSNNRSSIEELLNKADVIMYERKNESKRSVVTPLSC